MNEKEFFRWRKVILFRLKTISGCKIRLYDVDSDEPVYSLSDKFLGKLTDLLADIQNDSQASEWYQDCVEELSEIKETCENKELSTDFLSSVYQQIITLQDKLKQKKPDFNSTEQ